MEKVITANRKTSRTLVGLIAAPLILGASLVMAGDPESGKELYDEVDIHANVNGVQYTNATCTSCHEASVYQPKERLSTISKLEAMVERCNTNLDVGWFPEDVSDVAAYLNKEYYHLEK